MTNPIPNPDDDDVIDFQRQSVLQHRAYADTVITRLRKRGYRLVKTGAYVNNVRMDAVMIDRQGETWAVLARGSYRSKSGMNGLKRADVLERTLYRGMRVKLLGPDAPKVLVVTTDLPTGTTRVLLDSALDLGHVDQVMEVPF